MVPVTTGKISNKGIMKGCSKEAALFYAGGLAMVSICKCQIVTVVTPSYHPLEPDDRSTYTLYMRNHTDLACGFPFMT